MKNKNPSSFYALFLAGLLLITHGQAFSAFPLTVDNKPLPSLAPMLEKTTLAVVNIATRGHVQVKENPLLNDPFFRRFFDVPNRPRTRKTQSLGSGVIVDAKKGYILTNNHVVGKADEITVTLRDGRSFEAKIVGTDPESDIAVIQIPAEQLQDIPVANSDQLRVGDFVVAIGNPFGLGQTVTSGIVSALSRSGLGIEGYEDFIQTDASINPGNSGGALVNLRGELVGINTAIIAPGGGNVGIGFAIPTNMAMSLMSHLVTHGEVNRGRLGVAVQDLTPDLAKAFGLKNHHGAVITQILKGSPAEKADLKPGDIIISINDKKIKNGTSIRNAVGLLRIGDSVSMEVLHKGQQKTVTAIIAEKKSIKISGRKVHPALTGAELAAVTKEANRPIDVEGIRVEAINVGSPAWQNGLKKGDIIAMANRRPVKTLQELADAVHGSKSLLLNIQRNNGAFFLVIR
ncbi:MAG: serine endoprotease DegQ [Gammaproteobacteria bacterium]|nr:MAG: serine endoprotease DegQ [Gammaproteobacteria bacterium]